MSSYSAIFIAASVRNKLIHHVIPKLGGTRLRLIAVSPHMTADIEKYAGFVTCQSSFTTVSNTVIITPWLNGCRTLSLINWQVKLSLPHTSIAHHVDTS